LLLDLLDLAQDSQGLVKAVEKLEIGSVQEHKLGARLHVSLCYRLQILEDFERSLKVFGA